MIDRGSGVTRVPVTDPAHNLWRRLEHGQELAGKLAPQIPYLIVIDANAAISDVLWMVARKYPAASTALRNAIAERHLVAFAPPCIREEVTAHLARLAEEWGASPRNKADCDAASARLEILRAEWARLEALLVIVEPRDLTPLRIVVDPDDLPYVCLCEELTGDAVLTRDRHIALMGGTAVSTDEMRHWRNYALAASEAYPLRQAGVVATSLTVLGGAALVQLAVGTWKRLPGWVRPLVVLGALYGLCRLASRPPRALETRGATDSNPSLSDVLLQFVERHDNATSAMLSAKGQFTVLPRERSLDGAALAALGAARSPLFLADLLRRMEALGCPPGRLADPSSVASMLASSPDFARRSDGGWGLSAARLGPRHGLSSRSSLDATDGG